MTTKVQETFDWDDAYAWVSEGYPMKPADKDNYFIVLAIVGGEYLTRFVDKNYGPGADIAKLRMPNHYLVLRPTGQSELMETLPEVCGGWVRATDAEITALSKTR